MDELISVIIPIYNGEKFLKECINSVINQSYKKIEIILINDGSKDSSQIICEEMCTRDKRIILINKKNEGVSIARNVGLEKSKGKYIVFIDSDDYIKNNYIENLYNLCKENDAQMSICGHLDFYTESAEIRYLSPDWKCEMISNNVFKEMLLERNIFATVWGCMFEKDVFEDIKFDSNLKIGEDLEFLSNILMNYFKVAIDLSQKLYCFRINEYSVTSQSVEKSWDKWIKEIELCEKIIKCVDVKMKKAAIKRYLRVNLAVLSMLLNNKCDSYYLRIIKNNLYKFKNFYSYFGIKDKIKLFFIYNNFDVFCKCKSRLI